MPGLSDSLSDAYYKVGIHHLSRFYATPCFAHVPPLDAGLAGLVGTVGNTFPFFFSSVSSFLSRSVVVLKCEKSRARLGIELR